MAPQIDTCPNCGHQREIKVVLSQRKGARLQGRRGQMESTASMPPIWYGKWRSIFWFLNFNNEYNPDLKERIIVRSEYKPNPHQTLITELKIRATDSEIRQLADVYIRQGYGWSKQNTVNNTKLGSGKHDNLKDDFLELHFLRDVGAGNKIEYELTDAGKRFLSYYLDNAPSPPPLWRYPGEKQLPYLVNGSQ